MQSSAAQGSLGRDPLPLPPRPGQHRLHEAVGDNDAGDMPAPAPNLVSLAEEGVIVVFSGKDYLRGK